MKKLLIVALLLTLLIPMVIETSFAQEFEELPLNSNDRIFRSTYKIYPTRGEAPDALHMVEVYHNKLYRGSLNRTSLETYLGEYIAIFSGHLTFTGIYQYSDVTPY